MRDGENTIFEFTEMEDGMYRIYYDKELAQGENGNKFVGAVFTMMKQYPELVEEVLTAALTAADDLSKPFYDILNNERQKN